LHALEVCGGIREVAAAAAAAADAAAAQKSAFYSLTRSRIDSSMCDLSGFCSKRFRMLDL
jgi:hypothetical protein